MTFELGDIVARISDDEHEVIGKNPAGDLIFVKCINPDYGGCYAVGFEEWNLPGRYTFVRKSDQPRIPSALVLGRKIGDIGNSDGDLQILAFEGKFYWTVTNYDGPDWKEIPEHLYRALESYENARHLQTLGTPWIETFLKNVEKKEIEG